MRGGWTHPPGELERGRGWLPGFFVKRVGGPNFLPVDNHHRQSWTRVVRDDRGYQLYETYSMGV